MGRKVKNKLENVFSFSSLAWLEQGNNYWFLSCPISRALLLAAVLKDWFALCYQLRSSPQPHWREKLAGQISAWCFRSTGYSGHCNLSSLSWNNFFFGGGGVELPLKQHLWFYNRICTPSHKVPDAEGRCSPLSHFYHGRPHLCGLHCPPCLFLPVPPQLRVTPSAWDNSCRALLLFSSPMPQAHGFYKVVPCFDPEMWYVDRAWPWAGGMYQDRLKEDLSLQLVLTYCPTFSSLWSRWRAFPDFNANQGNA